MFARIDYIDIRDPGGGRAVVRNFASAVSATTLSQVVSTGHEIGLEEDRFTTLLLPLSGAVFCATGSRDLSSGPGEALLLPPGRRRTLTRRDTEQAFHAIVVNLAGLPCSPGLPRRIILKDHADLARVRAALIALCATGGPGSDEVFAAADRLLRETLRVDSLPQPGRERHRRGVSAALARAETVMQERFSEDLPIPEVAEAAGISLRQLQDLFRQRHGLSPHAFLTRLRLEAAHLALKASPQDQTVTEAALAAGFSHLGRFPATYRARFGQLPSETRAALR